MNSERRALDERDDNFENYEFSDSDGEDGSETECDIDDDDLNVSPGAVSISTNLFDRKSGVFPKSIP